MCVPVCLRTCVKQGRALEASLTCWLRRCSANWEDSKEVTEEGANQATLRRRTVNNHFGLGGAMGNGGEGGRSSLE